MQHPERWWCLRVKALSKHLFILDVIKVVCFTIFQLSIGNGLSLCMIILLGKIREGRHWVKSSTWLFPQVILILTLKLMHISHVRQWNPIYSFIHSTLQSFSTFDTIYQFYCYFYFYSNTPPQTGAYKPSDQTCCLCN